MQKRYFFKAMAATLLAGMQLTGYSQANLIANPSFEDGTATTCATGGSGCSTSPGSCYLCTSTGSFLPGWQLKSGNLDRYMKGGDPQADFYAGVPDGNWALDMNGNVAAAITQTVTGLTTGINYTLGISFTNNMKGTPGGCTQDKPLQVNIYNSSNVLIATKNFSTAGLSSLINKWSSGSLTFMPATSTIIVEIKSLFGDASTVSTCGCCSVYTSFYGPGIDRVTLIPGNKPLPVKLLSFGVQRKENNIIDITWVTGMESNLHHFEIETGTDGLHFKTVAIVAASGKEEGSSYSYRYLQPNTGIRFYRVKEVDKDAATFYSDIKTIALPAGNNFIIKQPGKGNYIIAGLGDGSVLKLYTMQGALVMQRAINGATSLIDLNPFKKGVYLLHVINGTGIPGVIKLINQ